MSDRLLLSVAVSVTFFSILCVMFLHAIIAAGVQGSLSTQTQNMASKPKQCSQQ